MLEFRKLQTEQGFRKVFGFTQGERVRKGGNCIDECGRDHPISP